MRVNIKNNNNNTKEYIFNMSSAVKPSQIHDGFATIRSRGLQRSRSRVEQLERLQSPNLIIGKSDSMPLYEINKHHSYSNDSTSNGSNDNVYYNFNHSSTTVLPLQSAFYKKPINSNDGSFEITNHANKTDMTNDSKNTNKDDTDESAIGINADVQHDKNLLNNLSTTTCNSFKHSDLCIENKNNIYENLRSSSLSSPSPISLPSPTLLSPPPPPRPPLSAQSQQLQFQHKQSSSHLTLPMSIPNLSTDSNSHRSLFNVNNHYENVYSPTATTSPDSIKSNEYFLYTRPESPKYGRIGFKDEYINSSKIKNELSSSTNNLNNNNNNNGKIFTPTYYKKDTDSFDLAFHKVIKNKPPIGKSQTLQHYRKSYSHPETTTTTVSIQQPSNRNTLLHNNNNPNTIYEDLTMDNIKNNEKYSIYNNYYNANTNYFSPHKLYENYHLTNSESFLFNNNYHHHHNNNNNNNYSDNLTDEFNNYSLNETASNGINRRFATLSHPKDTQFYRDRKILQQQQQQQQFHNDQQQEQTSPLDYLDPLDCKIGCQTTLRSKPRIPWYELAIKKENRRQSCPPFQAHVVAAFEQSLTNMTQRLQQLSVTAERKDSELTEMRQTIELLRKQSIQAGLTTAHIQSMGDQTNNNRLNATNNNNNTVGSGITVEASALNSTDPTTHNSSSSGNMQRHLSSDSMCSLNSVSSGCSTQDKKKKKGWLRSSFTKAFSRNAKISKTNKHLNNSVNLDQHNQNSNHNHTHHHNHNHNHHQHNNNNHHKSALQLNSDKLDGSLLSSLPPPSPTKSPQRLMTVIENAKPIDAVDTEGNPVVEDLKKQLREKDLVLTDIRLEALSSASQLESLKDTVIKMRQEMMNLKQNNERLQKLVTSRSLAGSEISLGGCGISMCGNGGSAISPSGSLGEPRRYSLADGNLRPPLELPKSLDETEEENIPPAPAPEPPPSAQSTSLSPVSHHSSNLTSPSPIALDNLVSEHMTRAVDDHIDPDGKKISIVVYLGQPESFQKYLDEIHDCDEYYTPSIISSVQSHTNAQGVNCGNTTTTSSSISSASTASTNKLNDIHENGYCYDNNNQTLMNSSGSCSSSNNNNKPKSFAISNSNEFIIAYTYISGKTTWQNLDYIVRKTFKDYLGRIDPGANLGLNTDSITSYHLGEAKRGPEMGFPELLPCGYIIGNVKSLYICLQGVGCLAFDSLIPKSIVHRYISLLTEHRRLILCGPSGTGKSYLARKLAEFLVARCQRGNPTEAIATFNVDHKSSKELRQYLGHIAEQAASMSADTGASELPSVIILDNLHHASALSEVFQVLLSAGPATKLPCIIGTMSQATCNTTNLQLHHNFRWVLTANHMEPVKGFLGRFLRRRFFMLDLSTHVKNIQIASVIAWLPTVWQHINRFLETHSSSDVTIGPRLFLSCPLDLRESEVWFTGVWNYHLVPYLIEAVREGVQLYGRRGGAWVDPSTFIRDTYPWPMPGVGSPVVTIPTLRQISAEDVGLEGGVPNNCDSQDPLLNMLMRLQEAANYNGNQDQESDCASIDSNMTQDSSAGAD